jgi:hypothetical protein
MLVEQIPQDPRQLLSAVYRMHQDYLTAAKRPFRPEVREDRMLSFTWPSRQAYCRDMLLIMLEKAHKVGLDVQDRPVEIVKGSYITPREYLCDLLRELTPKASQAGAH